MVRPNTQHMAATGKMVASKTTTFIVKGIRKHYISILVIVFMLRISLLIGGPWKQYPANFRFDPQNFVYDLISFNDLIGKFDKSPPITDVIPECLNKPSKAPPIILMSRGRSGSTAIWQMLSDLTKDPNQEKSKGWRQRRTLEYPGSNVKGNLYFFDTTIGAEEKLEIEDENNVGHILRKSGAEKNEVPGKGNSEHGEWLVNYVCRLRKERPLDLVGFKWKPNFDQFVERKEARESMQLLASLASTAAGVEKSPPILIVRSRRNVIDVRLSGLKHKKNSEVLSQCRKGDEECLKKNKAKLFVDNVPQLYRAVFKQWNEENLLDEMLDALKVPYISTSYDTLFYPDKISDGEAEWNRLIQFVQPSLPNFTWEEIQNSMEFTPTKSVRDHDELIENWEDVYKAFQGTEIEHLFRKG